LSTPTEFDVRVDTTSPGVAIVRVLGELDMAASPHVEAAIAAAMPTSKVVVDLTGCTFLDSSGIRVLVAAQRDVTAQGGGVELVADDPNLLGVLDITNLKTVMTIHSTLEAAL
jgi:anti-anti-sigma factor